MGESQENTSSVPNVNREKIEKKADPEEKILTDQNIPDWLRRIRELKEADQPPEEKDPNWRQQDLFVSEEKPQKKKVRGKKRTSLKEKTAHYQSKRKKADNQILLTEQNKRPKQTNDAGIQKKHIMEKLEKDPETLSDELPEGFIKL